MATKTVSKKSTTKTATLPAFKAATLAMYNLLKSGKSISHAGVMKFAKENKLRSAYQILFRLRRIGLKFKAFTIEPVNGDAVRTERSYKLVKGVKGADTVWAKANPVRDEKPKSKKPATKKAAAKKPTTQKKQVVKKGNVKKAVKASTVKQIVKAKAAQAAKAAPTQKEVLEAQLKAALNEK